jgi:NAD(P)-dependent dehydrogenase (short-subunit alcohol dehydrogenase family)
MPRRVAPGSANTGRRTILVTGGARRIGRAIALEAARQGWDVVVTYRRSADAARHTAREIQSLGRRAVSLRVDQLRPDSLRRAARDLQRRGIRIDLLVNSAAAFEPTPLVQPRRALNDRAMSAHWDRILGTNLKGPFFVIRAFLPLLNDGGSVVNIADAAGIVPWPGHAAYAASKAGLIMLTRVLARALAPRLRVNAVCPGPILPGPGVSRAAWRRAVGKTALRRAGSPSDVARAVLFLAGSRFTTGQALLVDGGRHLAF